MQIGDPFEESKVLECCLELLAKGLLVSLQDLGAAGLTSSAGEMASAGGVGIEIDVARVPLREADMEPFEIMVSESQERMLAVVEPDRVGEVIAVCEKWQTGAAEIGEVTDNGLVRVLRGEEVTGEMPVEALVDGCPLYDLEPAEPEEWIYGNRATLDLGASAAETLLALLAAPSIASKRWAFEQYDSIVGSRTARRPESADAAVLAIPEAEHRDRRLDRRQRSARRLRPLRRDGRGGARVRPEPRLRRRRAARPHQLPQLRQPGEAGSRLAARPRGQGLADACEALGVPVVGGNVSLYNEGPEGPIYPTPVVGMVGELPDAGAGRAERLRRRGRRDRPGRPLRTDARGQRAGEAARRARPGLPQPDVAAVAAACATVREAVRAGALASAHDVSDGGLACALAECAIGAGLGCRVDLQHLRERGCTPEEALFGEGAGGFVLSGERERLEALAADGVASSSWARSAAARSRSPPATQPLAPLADAESAWRRRESEQQPPTDSSFYILPTGILLFCWLDFWFSPGYMAVIFLVVSLLFSRSEPSTPGHRCPTRQESSMRSCLPCSRHPAPC